ncbi:MAG TPA: cell division ATP-binding protein FtsE [Candidatus Fimenecus excrementavium]|nr:cell division ATP-binding protein FtsE [Candidatus Fimenecus excrementavium]
MIEFKNVSKTYDNGTQALKNVNLRIEDGEFVFVVGSSGAGKSTFLKIIMREQVANSGTVLINGFNLNTMRKRDIPMLRRTMGIVFQDFRLIPTMTVFDNVAFAMRVIGTKEKEIRKRVPYILSLVGLTSKARQLPTQLSGGEQQRVALARALVNNAGILIADEPTGNIDPEMSYEIVDLLNHINANGTTVVMVTHEHNLVRHFHHRVITIEEGSVVSDTSDTDKLPDDYASIEANYPTDTEPAKDEESPSKEEVLSDTTVEESKTSSFYFQPNEDKDLEDFMQNYGLTDDDIAEDTLDYSAYLSSDETSNGGDAK